MDPVTKRLLKSCLDLVTALQYSSEEIVEYSSWTSDTIRKCPLCFNYQSAPHEGNCPLGVLIRDLTEAVNRD